MSRKLSEEKVLKKLKISDFRHMTKDKVVKLCSMLPYMDPEVAKKVLEQFPEYSATMGEMVKVYADVASKVLESGREGARAFYDACNSVLDEIKRQLEMPNLSESNKDKLNDKMISVVKMIGEKDTEAKKFALDVLKTVGGVVLSFAALVAAVLGINFLNKDA